MISQQQIRKLQEHKEIEAELRYWERQVTILAQAKEEALVHIKNLRKRIIKNNTKG
jgi:hypothetical protein